MKRYKNTIEWSLRLFFISLFIEVLIFNFPFWKTMNYDPIEMPLSFYTYGPTAVLQADGSLFLCGDEEEHILQYDISMLKDIKLENMSVSAYCTNGDESWDTYDGHNYAQLHSEMVEITVVLTEGEKNEMLPSVTGGDKNHLEKILRFPKHMQPQLITMRLRGLKGNEVLLKSLYLNIPHSFVVKPLRIVVLYVMFLFVYAIRPNSVLWEFRVFTEGGRLKNSFWRVSIIVGVMIAMTTVWILLKNPVYLQGDAGFTPYRELAHAFAEGHCYIADEPNSELLALEDPYDPVERLKAGVSFKLDYALFQGRYYVYFGVIPCLVFYLPLYLLFGLDIPGYIVVYILILLLLAGLWWLTVELTRRYFRNVSAALFTLGYVMAVAVLSIPAVVSDPNAYYIPMLSAIVCYVYAACMYFRAIGIEKGARGQKGYLAAGSLLMAMITGCRPQIFFAGLALLPLLFPILVVKKSDKIRLEWENLLACVLPMIPIAAGLMYYNWIRFGSPFDFGASYNLTFAYAYRLKVYIESIGAGIFYYLFRPARLSLTAPYLIMTQLEWSNPALLANHISTGGIFMLYPVLFCVFVLVGKSRVRGMKNTDTVLWMGRIWILLTIIMAVLTAVMGGLMDRYRMDISIFAALSLLIALFKMEQMQLTHIVEKVTANKSNRIKYMIYIPFIIRGIVVFVAVVTVSVSALTYFEEGVWWIYSANPEWYTSITESIEFWR